MLPCLLALGLLAAPSARAQAPETSFKFTPSAAGRSESLIARTASVMIGSAPLTVGLVNQAAEPQLDCAASTVQHTIKSCKLKAAAAPAALFLGRRVDAVTLNAHFQGQLINMSVELASGSDADGVVAQLKTALGSEPKVQYWADPSHLYASYIWVDGIAEVELTKTVKGDAGDGKVRLYVSSLLGGLPISPEDQP